MIIVSSGDSNYVDLALCPWYTAVCEYDETAILGDMPHHGVILYWTTTPMTR